MIAAKIAFGCHLVRRRDWGDRRSDRNALGLIEAFTRAEVRVEFVKGPRQN